VTPAEPHTLHSLDAARGTIIANRSEEIFITLVKRNERI
jgi:hypothetical protein